MSHTIGKLDGPTREALVVLGQVVRQLRWERGLSQRGLARRSGLSQSTISRLENGIAEGVRVAWIARLLAGLDTTVRVLPDARPMLERHHGFRHLARAFSPAAGNARRGAREHARRARLEAYAQRIRREAAEPRDRRPQPSRSSRRPAGPRDPALNVLGLRDSAHDTPGLREPAGNGSGLQEPGGNGPGLR